MLACATYLLLFSQEWISAVFACWFFAMVLVCFSSLPHCFFYWSISGSPWTSVICYVASIPLDLRTLLFYPLASLSTASLGHRCWSSSTKSSSSSSLLGRLFHPDSKHYYGFVWTSSFVEVTTTFCSLPVDSSGFSLLRCVEVFTCVCPFGSCL
jgi:hypothetical protein